MSLSVLDRGELFQQLYADNGKLECKIIRYAESGGSNHGGREPDKVLIEFPIYSYPVVISDINPNRFGLAYGSPARTADIVTEEKRFGVDISTSGKEVMVKGIQLQNGDLLEIPPESGKKFLVGPATIEWDEVNEISTCMVRQI